MGVVAVEHVAQEVRHQTADLLREVFCSRGNHNNVMEINALNLENEALLFLLRNVFENIPPAD